MLNEKQHEKQAIVNEQKDLRLLCERIKDQLRQLPHKPFAFQHKLRKQEVSFAAEGLEPFLF